MAAAGIRPGNEGAAALTSEWDAEIRLKPTEEMVVVSDFSSPVGVDDKNIQNLLTIRILPTITAQTLASTDQGQGSGLTYHTGTILSVTASPVFTYGAVELPAHLLSKMTGPDGSALKAGYRKQLMAALGEKIDNTGAQLATGVSTQKGAPSNFDKPLLLDAKGTLQTNAKNHVKAGKTQIHLKYHPSQIKYLESISEIMNADARGGGDSPNVAGVVVKAWGLTLAESGNVYSTGGVVYNFMFASQGFVLGYNLEPGMLDPQTFELVTRFIARAEFGVVEVFDEDGVAIKSAA